MEELKDLSPQQKADFYECFKAFDQDGNGFIDISEIEQMLTQLHIKYSRAAIVKNVRNVDEDGNGYMDFDEFCVFMLKSKPKDKPTELRNIFRLVDTDNSGEIDREELKKLLVNVGHMNLSETDLDDMFECIDVDKSGVIRYDDFVLFFRDVV